MIRNQFSQVLKIKEIFASVLLALLIAGVPAVVADHPIAASQFKEVPTQLCACQLEQMPIGSAATPAAFRPGAAVLAPDDPVYDEQIGLTFTQSFTSMAYNVTAVEQTDSASETGPAYLLNGLTDQDFWYQVGVSWNWNPGASPGTGFDMNYEVFDVRADSVYPTDGSGGVQVFSGTVNQGDTILLNLYFSDGNVMMVAHDWDTGASSSQNYSAQGATAFQGDPSSNSNKNGFFTGLMSEWYHPQPYFSNEQEVVFMEDTAPVTSAWLWMDEFNANNLQTVFTNETSTPVSFVSDPTKLHEFSSNGATEYADAYELITGAMNATGTVPLTFSYAVVGGGQGYSAPVLAYVSRGIAVNATLSTSPTTFNADVGSKWSVGRSLTGLAQSNTTGERWQTDQPTTGNATGAHTVEFTYHHQFAVAASYTIVGAAAATAPILSFTGFGASRSANVTTRQTVFWLDASTSYGMTNPLPGSTSQERWITASTPNGTATAPATLAPVYYQQFLVTLSYSVAGGGNLTAPGVPHIAGVEFGHQVNGTLTLGATSEWLDAGSAYNLTQSITGATAGASTPDERWITNSTSGLVSGALNIDAGYVHQYLVTLQQSSQQAGSLSTPGGWYDAGSQFQVTANASSGWKFEFWNSSASSQAVSDEAIILVPVDGPLTYTGVFYPGLTITAGPDVSVAYSSASGGGPLQGSVSPGSQATVYPSPSGIKLSSTSSSFLYAFSGWSGASTSSSPTINLVVTQPESLTAKSLYNYLDVAIILGAVIVVIAALTVMRARSKNRKTVGSPAA